MKLSHKIRRMMNLTWLFCKTFWRHRKSFFILLMMGLLNACKVMYPNKMFDADKDYMYESFLDSIPQDFKIAPGDEFELFIFPEKGYNLIESQIMFQNINQQAQDSYSLNYSVSETGEVNIPMIGFIKLGGLTEIEAEKLLTGLYKANYVDPFVNFQFTSEKTAQVFRGSSDAKSVLLTRPDMTILEVISIAGGVPENAKPSNIKVFRNTGDSILVQSIDLSNISGMTEANKYVRPNDVIYIEPGLNPQFFEQVAPILSVFTSVVIVYAYFSNFNSK